jgi:hypothetical protein
MKTLNVTNIKKYTNKSFQWEEGTNLLLLKGSNGTGKSTFEQIMRTLLTANSDMKDPVTKGEKSGGAVYHTKDIHGNPMVVTWDHIDGADKFKCSIVDGGTIKKVSAITKIRELIGNHFRYTVHDVFTMLSSPAGRKKFIDDFVLSLMTEDDRTYYENAIIEISEKKSKATEDNIYFQRRYINKEIDIIAGQLEIVVNWDDNLAKELANIEKEYNKQSEYNTQIKTLDDKIILSREKSKEIVGLYSEMESLIERFKSDYDIDTSSLKFNDFKEHLRTLLLPAVKLRDDMQLEIDAINNKLQVIDDSIDRMHELRQIKKSYAALDEKRAQLEYLTIQSEKLTKEIEGFKDGIKAIFERTKLPSTLTVENDEVLLNGLKFDELSVADSEARLAVIELLAIVNDSKFVDIGDITVFDDKNKTKLLDIAKAYNSTLIAQQVTNNDDMELEIIVK